jgi:NAD(P)-dependent dehydrogenase (short-subunit alcohol dehydrogenase family)
MGTLSNKTALVTGGSRGIGRAIALRLAAEGALVAVHYGGNDLAAKDTVALIEGNGGRAFTVRAQFGTNGAVDRFFDGLTAGIGDRGLDILVNNAGILSGSSISQLTPEEFDRLLAINVTAPLHVIQRALPLLNDGGRIINIGSTASRFAVSTQISYTITKAAVEALAPSLANELCWERSACAKPGCSSPPPSRPRSTASSPHCPTGRYCSSWTTASIWLYRLPSSPAGCSRPARCFACWPRAGNRSASPARTYGRSGRSMTVRPCGCSQIERPPCGAACMPTPMSYGGSVWLSTACRWPSSSRRRG